MLKGVVNQTSPAQRRNSFRKLTWPLQSGGVRQTTDCRSVPSESPPDAACFPEYLPGNKYAGVIGAGSWFVSGRPDNVPR